VTQSSLQRSAAGHTEAVRESIHEYGALIWTLASRLSRTPAEAENATQEIFQAIWRDAARFDASKGSDKDFIIMIARRRLIDRMSKRVLERPVDSQHEHDVNVLSALRREQREVVELSLIGGVAQSEIATHLAIPSGTVKSSMRRGLTKLREFINPPGPPEPSLGVLQEPVVLPT
jgi:RNA polymerase sigma-70 factor, ECF subfamily